MRVLYVHQYFVPPGGSGGTRSYELATRLAEMGHDVTLITSDACFPKDHELVGANRGDLDGIDLRVVPVPYSNHMSYARRVRAFFAFALRSIREIRSLDDFDVVFATSTPLTVAIPGIFAKKAFGRPLVFEVRDLWPDLPIAVGALRSRPAIWLARRLERRAYRESARVVALSPGMAAGVERQGYSRERIHVIPNGCDAAFQSSDNDGQSFLARYPELRGGPLVTYAGTVGAVNDVSYLVDVAHASLERSSPARFLIVGDGRDLGRVEERARELGVLGVNLWIKPPVPKDDMPGVLAASTVGACLLRAVCGIGDSSPNKVFDTLASGRPVLINFEGWLADLVRGHGLGLVVDPRNPEGAASRLLDFLSDERAIRGAGRHALRVAREQFDRDDQARQLAGVLGEAANDRVTTPPMARARSVGSSPRWQSDGSAGAPTEETMEPATIRKESTAAAVTASNGMKRFVDVSVAALALALSAPVLLVAGIAIRCSMGRPVLFTQRRIGLGAASFTMYKLRTMTSARNSSGELMPDADRLTALGSFLRWSSIDELPELWNVLKGDMSLVGPRPLLPEYLPLYDDRQARRHEVRPGITGIAQVSGRNALSWDDRLALDVWYVDHRTHWLDLRILFRTAVRLLAPRGINQPGRATADRFLGPVS